MRAAAWTAVGLVCVAGSQLAAQEIDISGKTSVTVVLKHNPPGTDRSRTFDVTIEGVVHKSAIPTGTVFDVKARQNGSLRFRIEGLNMAKYTVKEAAEAPKEPALELPKVFSDAFKKLIPALEIAGKNPPKGITPAHPSLADVLEGFVRSTKALEAFGEQLETAGKCASFESSGLMATCLTDRVSNGPFTEDWVRDRIATVRNIYRQLADDYRALPAAQEGDSVYMLVLHGATAIKKEADVLFDSLDAVEKRLVAYATGRDTLFTYTSAKGTAFPGGALTVKVVVFLASDKKQENAIYEMTFELHSRSRSFFDVSTGVFFSNIRDESYALEERTDSATGKPYSVIVRKGAEDDARACFGALVHTGWMAKDFGLAVSLGLAVSSDRYEFYLGPSVALGADRHFYITAGAALAKVARLDNYDLDTDPYPGKESDIPTKAVNRWGGFVGVSYKF